MRKTIISIVGGLVILGLSFALSSKLSNSKKAPETSGLTESKSVYTNRVKNQNIPISITTSGSLLAKQRMAIYAEVQGVFMPSRKSFKPGETYKKGESLVRINNAEYKANVIAQRSSFKALVTSILPDLQFDYPEAYADWKSYLSKLDIQKNLPELPQSNAEQVENYLVGKNVNTTYYTIKNLETRLAKYTISAPYSGVLVATSINPGALVNAGQKLGEYIQPNIFELELNVNANLQDFLNIGKKVALNDIEHTQTYEGTVTRINEQIDRNSQTIKIFVEVHSKTLREGEYLEANINAQDAENAIEIPRSLLLNNEAIYVVKNGTLHIQPVHVFYANLNTVIIKGLPDGLEYISKPITGGFEGMKVKVIKAV